MTEPLTHPEPSDRPARRGAARKRLALLVALTMGLMVAAWLLFDRRDVRLDPNANEPSLRTARVQVSPLGGVQLVTSRLASLPGWMIETVDGPAGKLVAQHTSWGGRHVDRVTIEFTQADQPDASNVTARSTCTDPLPDLGQNVRNLRQLTQAVLATINPGDDPLRKGPISTGGTRKPDSGNQSQDR